MTNETRLQEVLSAGPDLRTVKEWQMINNSMLGDGLPGITTKVEIGGHDLYLKTVWFRGRVVRIDITLSRGTVAGEDVPKSGHAVSLEATRFDLARSWLENECRMASNLLQTGSAGIGTIIEEWTMVSGFPSGHCPQLPPMGPDGPEEGATFQCGPLHAIAMILRKRLPDWAEQMKGI